ncbi:MAG: hypothetical protein ACK2T2_02140 [Anaerolineales bacterium]
MDAKELLTQGFERARQGDTASARSLIARAVRADPTLKQGWWALANLLEDPAQQQVCLKQVLKLDPEHRRARARLDALQAAAGKADAGPAQAPIPPGGGRKETGQPAAGELETLSPRTGRRPLLFPVIGITAVIVLVIILAAVLSGGWLGGLTAGFPGGSKDPTAGVPAPTLPPSWTPTASPTPRPTAVRTPSAASTPLAELALPTATPVPGYAESAWMVRIEGPAYSSADALVEMSDGSILAKGNVYDQGSLHSTWLARIERTGMVAWLRTVPIGPDQRFLVFDIGAGPGDLGMISGSYYPPAGGGGSISQAVLLAVAPGGSVEWRAPFRPVDVEETGADSVVFFTSLGAGEIRSDGQLGWHASFDFGPEYTPIDDFYPAPHLLAGDSLSDGGVLVGGVIEDEVVPGDMVARAGPDPGYTHYWLARFSIDGELRWKHVFTLDAVQEGGIYAVRTRDEGMIIGGIRRRRISTATDLYYVPLYAWLRKVDANGRTVFHQRYLDLAQLDGLATTPDGGLIIYGRSYQEEDGNPFAREQFKLVKLNPRGVVEWAREFPVDVRVKTVLPLSDGSYVLTIQEGLTFLRLNSEGVLPECAQVDIAGTRMRLDVQPAQFDIAGQVPLAMTMEQERLPAPMPLMLSAVGFTQHELCRSIPSESPGE